MGCSCRAKQHPKKVLFLIGIVLVNACQIRDSGWSGPRKYTFKEIYKFLFNFFTLCPIRVKFLVATDKYRHAKPCRRIVWMACSFISVCVSACFCGVNRSAIPAYVCKFNPQNSVLFKWEFAQRRRLMKGCHWTWGIPFLTQLDAATFVSLSFFIPILDFTHVINSHVLDQNKRKCFLERIVWVVDSWSRGHKHGCSDVIVKPSTGTMYSRFRVRMQPWVLLIGSHR